MALDTFGKRIRALRQELATAHAQEGTRMDYFVSGVVVGILGVVVAIAFLTYLW